MFRVYPKARIQRLLLERAGTFTTKLGYFDSGWNPADAWGAAVTGPADRVTYTLRPDGRVEVDIDRGQHRLAIGPVRQHGVSKDPLPQPAELAHSQRKGLLLIIVLSASLLTLAGVGFLVGYLRGGHRLETGVLGVAGGLFCAYVLQLGSSIVLGATRADRDESSHPDETVA